jgi:putative transposase
MQLRYSFRVYPTPGQRSALARTFGCARVVYNDALRVRKDAHTAGLPFPKSSDLSRQLITPVQAAAEDTRFELVRGCPQRAFHMFVRVSSEGRGRSGLRWSGSFSDTRTQLNVGE